MPLPLFLFFFRKASKQKQKPKEVEPSTSIFNQTRKIPNQCTFLPSTLPPSLSVNDNELRFRSPKPQFVPQSLVSDLQSALLSRQPAATPLEATFDEPTSEEEKGGEATTSPIEEAPGVESLSADVAQGISETKPVVLVTCVDGINSAGLEFLVTALISTGQYVGEGRVARARV